MLEGNVSVDRGEINSAVPRLERDILRAFVLDRITLYRKGPYLSMLLLGILIVAVNYVLTVMLAIYPFSLWDLITAIILPGKALVGTLAIIGFSYLASSIYVDLLTDVTNGITSYIYICMLGSVHLPIAIVLGRLLSTFRFLFIFLVAFASEYITRRSILHGRDFENDSQKIAFIGISYLMHIGFYFLVQVLFYEI